MKRSWFKALGDLLAFMVVQVGVMLAMGAKPPLPRDLYGLLIVGTFFLGLVISRKLRPWPKAKPKLADDASAIQCIARAYPHLLDYDHSKAIAGAVDHYLEKLDNPDDND